MDGELDRKYRAEVERLDCELAHYDRLWDQVPQFAWAALLAPVAGFTWGWAAAFVALFVAASLVGVRAYLIAMRKSEIGWTRARLLEDLSGERPAQSPARARAA